MLQIKKATLFWVAFFIFEIINLKTLTMKLNFSILFISAIVPLITGFIWYGPLFKKAWMKEVGFTEESMKGANMPLIFGLCYILGLLISAGLMSAVIHQMGIYATLANEPGFAEGTGEAFDTFKNLMSKYGNNFRDFKHGTIHGAVTGLFIALPILAIQAMFERKSFKYIAINTGYWIITLAIMGGIIAQWV